MKKKVLVLSCFLCLAVLIVIGSCATTTGPNKMIYERLYGTWANNAYEWLANPPVKEIFNPDGTGVYYNSLLKTGTSGAITYTIEKRWTDSEGNYWYHVIMKYPLVPSSTFYLLIKIDKFNWILERNYSNSDYPTRIDPKDMHSDYAMYYRF